MREVVSGRAGDVWINGERLEIVSWSGTVSSPPSGPLLEILPISPPPRGPNRHERRKRASLSRRGR